MGVSGKECALLTRPGWFSGEVKGEDEDEDGGGVCGGWSQGPKYITMSRRTKLVSR